MTGDTRFRQETRALWPGGMFWLSLLLVGTSYVLLLAAPLVSARLRGLASEAQWQSLAHWVPAASGAGLALGGGAALLRVLAKLSKDIRRHPYACVAPALAAFAACVMIGLGAKLPLGPSEPLCVFALALSVMGGSLVQESRAAGQLFGWSLTVAPSVSLVAAVWAASGESQLSQAIWRLTPSSRLFLAMLALSSVAMALLGMVARALASHEAQAHAAAVTDAPVGFAGTHRNPFPAREDTLDLDLRAAERELRKRPFARPALLATACVCVGIVAGIWHRASERSSRPLLAASIEPQALATRGAAPEGGAAALAPKVEPWVPPAADVGLPAGEMARVDPSEPAPPVRPPEPPVFAAELPSEPTTAAPVEADLEKPIVLTSRASHAPRKHKQARSHQKEADTQAAKTAPVEAQVAKAEAKASRDDSEDVSAPASERKSPKVVENTSMREQNNDEARQAARSTKPEKEAKEAKAPAVAAAPAKKPPAPTRGDEGLDELMDRVVDNKQGKPNVRADDPIFGL